jgi:hypothetical protein
MANATQDPTTPAQAPAPPPDVATRARAIGDQIAALRADVANEDPILANNIDGPIHGVIMAWRGVMTSLDYLVERKAAKS